MDQSTLQEIRAIPSFSNLSVEQTSCFEPGEIIQLEAGKVLMNEGDPVESFYVLLTGEMRASSNYGNQTILMGIVKPGMWFGELPLLLDSPTLATIRALKPCRLFRLGKNDFWPMLSACPSVARQIFRTMATRVRNIEGYSQQREKLASLGTMAAGLAHELNNPATAARRASAHLRQVVEDVQSFACELHQRLTPEEFRRRNFIKQGETTATSQTIHEGVDMEGLLNRAFEMSDYYAKRERFVKENGGRAGRMPAYRRQNVGAPRKGIGFASFMHGAGFTGSGEVYLQSVVGAEATSEGSVRILAASTEIGQGTNTVFAQIAAEALGLDYDLIEVTQPDTAQVPNSGPTVASRTCMIVGKLVESAVLGLKQTLIGSGLLPDRFTQTEFQKACGNYIQKFGPLKSFSKYEPPPGIRWDDEKYQGDAYGAFAWAVYVAEVSYDPLTYEVHVDDFVAVQEIGRVINPVLAAGQIEGGVAQAIGYTLYENVVWQNGRMLNSQMTNYIIPTAADIPPIRVYFEENPYAFGAAGAKGIGELPMDGPAPAILNAIENATGVSFNHLR